MSEEEGGNKANAQPENNNAGKEGLHQCKTIAEWTGQLIRYYRTTLKEDLAYLNAHPEIPEVVNLLVMEIEKHKPKDIYKFAALYFQHKRHNIDKLTSKLNK